jgi:hypothetical protein
MNETTPGDDTIDRALDKIAERDAGSVEGPVKVMRFRHFRETIRNLVETMKGYDPSQLEQVRSGLRKEAQSLLERKKSLSAQRDDLRGKRESHRLAVSALRKRTGPNAVAAKLGLRAQDPSRLVEFEISDQFEQLHRSSDYAGRYLVVIGSDRKGSSFNPKWGMAIEEGVGERLDGGQIAVAYLADLDGVPGFLKDFIRSKFPVNPRRWILMDWEGVFSGAYGFERKNSNIFLFGPTGELLMREFGREPDPKVVQRVVDAVEREDLGS